MRSCCSSAAALEAALGPDAALRKCSLATPRGTAAPDTLALVQQAGYGDAQIVDTLLAISAITFTNLFNRVNDTAVDFPSAPVL